MNVLMNYKYINQKIVFNSLFFFKIFLFRSNKSLRNELSFKSDSANVKNDLAKTLGYPQKNLILYYSEARVHFNNIKFKGLQFNSLITII